MGTGSDESRRHRRHSNEAAMALRDTLRHNWPAVTITVTVVAIVIAAIAIVLTMPPRTIVMATGPAGGAYYEIGERYRAMLARAGVEVRLVTTAGSPENLRLLLDPRSGVSVSLIQGGTIGALGANEANGEVGGDASSKLESLGTVFYEPLWLFHRRGVKNTGLASDLRNR